MRKLIAVLEDNAGHVEAMKEWLSDRLYMYDRFFDADPLALLKSIRPRLNDVLVLCLGLELESNAAEADAERVFASFLLAESPRFPILIHSRDSLEVGEMVSALLLKGWQVTSVAPADGVIWIGSHWYPAVKAAIAYSARFEPISAHDYVD